MEASILITVKNDKENLRRLLDSLKNQNLNNAEVVVVDAFSTDGTYELLESYSTSMDLNVARLKGNRAKGRNKCIEMANGEQLIFLDSDTEVSPGWLDLFRKYFSKPIVAGKILQKSNVKWSDLGRVPMIYRGYDVTFPSNNLKYSRKVIDEIGFFDERMHTAEDIDLNIRAVNHGYEIYYSQEPFVYHFPRENLRQLIKQSYYDGIGRRYIKQKYGLKSKFNTDNIKKHPFIESLRLFSGMAGYILGDFHD